MGKYGRYIIHIIVDTGEYRGGGSLLNRVGIAAEAKR